MPTAERNDATLRALLERIDYRAAAVDDPAALAGHRRGGARATPGRQRLPPQHRAALSTRRCATTWERSASPDAARGCCWKADRPRPRQRHRDQRRRGPQVFDERRVFRVDHYLGKEGVQNLLALRFGNALFEPLWERAPHRAGADHRGRDRGRGRRGDYYDDSGAMRDMLQNHLLQLLCLTAMEPPSQFDPSAVRNEKIKVLRSLRPSAAPRSASESVAGQYTAGAIDGVAVPAYREELGRGSGTETFVALRAHIDNWRWSGVPFYLRTGKRLPRALHRDLPAVPRRAAFDLRPHRRATCSPMP